MLRFGGVASFLLAIGVLAESGGGYNIGYLYPRQPVEWAVESYTLFRLALSRINADSSILTNHTLGHVLYDTRESASDALLGAITLLSDPSVIGLLGTAYSATIEAPSVYATLRKKPIVSPGSTSPSEELVTKRSFPSLIRSVANERDALVGLATAIADFGWRHVAVLGSQGAFGRDVYGQFRKHADCLGVQVVYHGSHPRFPSDAQLEPIMVALRASLANVVVVLSNTDDAPAVLRNLRRDGFYSPGYAVFLLKARGIMSQVRAALDDQPGLLYVENEQHTTTEQADFAADFASWTTEYNATSHGAYNATSHLPLYAPSGPFWDYGSGRRPSSWGVLAYDTAWLYAIALDALIRRGGDPSDGEALTQELVATRFQGASGSVYFDQSSQDRVQLSRLINLQRTNDGDTHADVVGEVEIGTLPQTSARVGGGRERRRRTGVWNGTDGVLPPWALVAVKWPGGSFETPSDGIQVTEISAATFLGLETSLAQRLLCAARLAERHVNSRDGSVVPELAWLSPSLRLRLFPFSTNLTSQGAVRALQAADDDHRADVLIGAQLSAPSIAMAARARGRVQISPTASSDDLSSKALYPGFARTHPADSQSASALVNMLRISFWSWSSIGIIYVREPCAGREMLAGGRGRAVGRREGGGWRCGHRAAEGGTRMGRGVWGAPGRRGEERQRGGGCEMRPWAVAHSPTP